MVANSVYKEQFDKKYGDTVLKAAVDSTYDGISFTDAEGNVSGAASPVYPELALLDGWLAGKEHTYYYTKAVEPGGFTPALCEPFLLAEETLRDGTAVFQVVQVFAECIQAEPSDAVQQSWGVTVINGTVTAVQ